MQYDIGSVDSISYFSNNLSLVQQKLWYYMLSLAHKNLKVKKLHTVSIARLINFLANTKDSKGIKRKLITIKKQTNNYYFEDIKFVNNNVYYSYPLHLIDLICSEKFLSTTKSLIKIPFTSKYAFTLYELILNHFQNGKTEILPIETLKKYLAISDKYKNFKAFNAHVILKAIKQINSLSPFYINISYIKQQRKVQAISFEIKFKKSLNKFFGSSLANLKQLHGTYLESKAFKTYDNLPPEVQEKLDQEYYLWCKGIDKDFEICHLAQKIKKAFLIQKLISPFEQDFELWTLTHGYYFEQKELVF